MKYLLEYNQYSKKEKPSIDFINPSEDKIVYNKEIEIEAIIVGGSDEFISLYLNNKYVNKSTYSLNNGRLFAKDVNLQLGMNQIKIIASENGKDWSIEVRKIEYVELKSDDFDKFENRKIMQTIETILRGYYDEDLKPFSTKTDEIYLHKGKILHSEYLSKWRNNKLFRTLLMKDFNIPRISTELIKFIIENKYDIFNTNGKYFDKYYKVMEHTSMKGKRIEDRSDKIFMEFARGKKMDIVIEKPSVEEDRKGIDSFFFYKDRKVTIQIKPLKRVKSNSGTHIELVSAGDVRKIITDYLIVSNDNECYIIKVPLKKLDNKQIQKTDDDILQLPDFETRDEDKTIKFSTEYLVYKR